MMSLHLFYRDRQSSMMKKPVKEFSRELEKVGARLRGTNYTDIQEQRSRQVLSWNNGLIQ